MGRPKAWLPFGDVVLLQRVVRRLRTVFPQIVVVGAEGQDLPAVDVPVVRDRRTAQGPLAGLEAALGSVASRALFVVSCDAPFLQPALARLVASRLEDNDAVVPRWQGRLNPLLAVYRTSLLPRVTKLLDAGRLRPAFLFDEVRTRYVQDEELRTADPEGLSFINMNGPDDYGAALASAPPGVTFELFGQPRVLAGVRQITVDVPAPSNVRAALAALARAVPALVGPVLDANSGLGTSFVLSADGRAFTRDPERPVTDGERLLLMSASAGG
jgi:molybdopterin-guanine dinucleotide biosynthesis protein A